MKQNRWNCGYALVTGASSGIGASFARLLARGGCNLVLTARREDRLEELSAELAAAHDVKVDVVAMDLSRPGSAALLTNEIHNRDIHIDLLVNNAGVGLSGSFANSDIALVNEMLQLNIISLVELTHGLIPPMVEKGKGDILMVGSIGAYIPSPTLAAYAASKSFVHNFSLALGYELKGTGVNVTVLNPGGTRSEWMSSAGMTRTKMSDMGHMDADEVAECGLKAMAAGKPCVEPGVMNKMAGKLMPVLPVDLRLLTSHYIQKAVGGKD